MQIAEHLLSRAFTMQSCDIALRFVQFFTVQHAAQKKKLEQGVSLNKRKITLNMISPLQSRSKLRSNLIMGWNVKSTTRSLADWNMWETTI